MTAVSSTFANPHAHPRVFINQEDIPTLRTRAERGIPARALAALETRCAEYCDPNHADFLAPSQLSQVAQSTPGTFADALHRFTFAWLGSGNEQWADKAIELMRTAVADGMETGTVAGELPIAYDLLYSRLTEADRTAVANHLRSQCVEPYQNGRLARPTAYNVGQGTNIFLHRFEEYVMALAAVYEPELDGDALEHCAELARESLHLGVDDGGQIGEGTSYGWGDCQWLATVSAVLHRAGIADLWAEEPKFRAFLRQWAYMELPGRRGQNAIGDSWRFAGTRPSWGHLIVARHSSDAVLQWLWERKLGRGTYDGIGTAPECFSEHLGWVLLWEDDDAASAEPSGRDWPLAKTSGNYAVTVMRSGWGEDDFYLCVLASGRQLGTHIHQHCDAGHFTLAAQGELYSMDSGYGDIGSRYHSVMRPHEQEPPCSKNRFDQIWPGGRTDAFALGRDTHYVRVEIARQWDCISYYRHVMMVGGPGVEPYALIVDNANYDNAHGSYEWLMNSEPGNTVICDQAGQRATVQGQTNRLEIGWGLPGPDDYPQRHRLEIESDEIDSFPLEHRVHDVDYFRGLPSSDKPAGGARWGAGIRPRLKARLWGYNGQLLSALVPRLSTETSVTFKQIAGRGNFGLVIDHGNVVDTIVTSPMNRHIDLAGLRGEAAIAIVRRDKAGAISWWAAADAYALRCESTTLLKRRGDIALITEADGHTATNPSLSSS